eukprot:NODE_5453_length_1769_cov_3.317905.p1 GENE.NODE_5453_length_1769_cov_3.317905~~NODE_5453_length_1769_cov_3.317905.p1  ORF type:complete len:310 (+),score=62.23 NODE_5453_length_1769_cov_3.317905:827-1756(+)
MSASCYVTILVTGGSQSTIGADLDHTAQAAHDEGSQAVFAFLELRDVHNVQRRGTLSLNCSASSCSGRGSRDGVGTPSGGAGGGCFGGGGGGGADSEGSGGAASSYGGAGSCFASRSGGSGSGGVNRDSAALGGVCGAGSRHRSGGSGGGDVVGGGGGAGSSGNAGVCSPVSVGRYGGVEPSDHGPQQRPMRTSCGGVEHDSATRDGHCGAGGGHDSGGGGGGGGGSGIGGGCFPAIIGRPIVGVVESNDHGALERLTCTSGGHLEHDSATRGVHRAAGSRNGSGGGGSSGGGSSVGSAEPNGNEIAHI